MDYSRSCRKNIISHDDYVNIIARSKEIFPEDFEVCKYTKGASFMLIDDVLNLHKCINQGKIVITKQSESGISENVDCYLHWPKYIPWIHSQNEYGAEFPIFKISNCENDELNLCARLLWLTTMMLSRSSLLWSYMTESIISYEGIIGWLLSYTYKHCFS